MKPTHQSAASQTGFTFHKIVLGGYEANADGVILLEPPFRFDATNIDDFDF